MVEELLKHIKSGEFTFCSRCGVICRRGDKNFMCTWCKHAMFPRGEITELEKQETLAEQAFEESVSDLCKTHRETLVELREDAE